MKGTGTLTVRTTRENDFVLVEIADNGPGIPVEVKSRIYRISCADVVCLPL